MTEPRLRGFRKKNVCRVARLLLLGWDDHRIAQEMGIGYQVVKNYAQVIYDATGANSRVEAAMRILNSRILLEHIYA